MGVYGIRMGGWGSCEQPNHRCWGAQARVWRLTRRLRGADVRGKAHDVGRRAKVENVYSLIDAFSIVDTKTST